MSFLKSKNGVDTHFHVFAAGQAVAGARYVPQYSARIDSWQQQAGAVGITHGVCVQPSFLGVDNSLLVQTLQAHPDVLRGVAVVHPAASPEDLAALHAAGVRGIRLNLSGTPHEAADWTPARQLWDSLQSLAWHVEVHTDPGRLPEVLAQLPAGLPLVVDHMAKPLQARADDASIAALRRRAGQGAVYVKLSGAYRQAGADPAAVARLLRDELGPQALLWGSDWPCTNHESHADFGTLMQAARQWIDAGDLDQVMVLNPMRLYWPEAEQVLGMLCKAPRG